MTNNARATIASLLPPDLASQLESATDGATQAAQTWFIHHIQMMQRFVPRTLLGTWQTMHDPDSSVPQVWQGSFVLADLSSFTAASEALAALGKEGAEEITRVIATLFTVLIQNIEHHGGDVIRFSGDALLGFFAEQRVADHAWRACQAALDIQNHMQTAGHVTTRLQTLQLQLRIGVHTGEILALLVGDTTHRELSLVGADIAQVTVAQHLAEPGSVVVSSITLKHVDASTQSINDDYAVLKVLEPWTPQPLRAITFPQPAASQAQLEYYADLFVWLKALAPHHLPLEYISEEQHASVNSIRLVTVLFAQFDTLHTTLLEHFAQNQAAAIINTIYQRFQATINRFGGAVNKLDYDQYGERLIAIFGAPISHDNDAQLATQAALALENELQTILADLQVQSGIEFAPESRISINSGHVFAGLVGSPHRVEYTVIGDMVNIAARLLSITAPHTITVGPLTSTFVQQRFELELLPKATVKGKSESIQAARIIGFRSTSGLSSQVALIGRQNELNTLVDQAEQSIKGAGCSVAVRGEPGIGKSRLLAECMQQITTAYPAVAILYTECQFHEQVTPFGIVRPLIQQLAQQQGAAPTIEALIKWGEQLVPSLRHFIPLLGDMYDYHIQATALLESLNAEQRHNRLLDLLEALIWDAAEKQPLMLVVDDIHWIDIASRELLERLQQRIEHHHVSIFVSYRPMLVDEPLNTTTVVDLQELDTPALIELATAFLNGEVPHDLIEHWYHQDQHGFNPQGNPFFVQEVLRTLISQGVLYVANKRWVIRGDIDTLPTTIEGIIAARLDHLPPTTREVVQTAAVIGRRFQHQLLEQLLPQLSIDEHLEYLNDVDILITDPLAVEATSMFKHALTRDVAYERMLYARRRELHAQIAGSIEDLYAHKAAEVQPLLAHHYAAAEEWLIAAQYGLGAGKYAHERYFNHEAIDSFRAAIGCLKQLDHPPLPMLLELSERCGYIQMQVGDYEAALESLQQALAIVDDVNLGPEGIARIMRHIATVYERRAEYDTCLEILNQALGMLDQNQINLERGRLLLLGAGLHVRQSRYHEAINWIEEALQITKAEAALQEQMHAYKLLGTVHAMIGNTDTAIQHYHYSIEIANQIDPPDFTRLSDVYNDLAITLLDRGQLNEAVELYKQAYDIKVMIGDVYGQALLMTNLGEAYRKLNLPDEAISSFQAALERWEALGSRYGIAVTNINLGATLIARKGFIAARRFLDQSLLLCEEIGSEEFISEIERHYAELELKTEDLDMAYTHIQRALEYAKRLEIRLDEGLAEHIQGRILLALQRVDVAIAAFERALVIFEQLDHVEAQRACLEDLAAAWHSLDPEQSRMYATRSLQLSTSS